MKFENGVTKDTLEVCPPNQLGEGVVLFNGRIVEHALYSDGGTVTLGDGRVYTSEQWSAFLMEQLRTGAYKEPTLATMVFDLPAGAEPLFICWQKADGAMEVHGCDDTSSEDIAKAVAKLYRFMHPGGAKA